MYTLTQPPTVHLPDLDAFLDTLNRVVHTPPAELPGFLAGDGPVHAARAPGRLDVMGGIADYSGSLVLQLPIREATYAAVQRRADRLLRLYSLGDSGNHREHVLTLPLDALLDARGRPLDYPRLQALFRREPGTAWAAYVLGAFPVLMREQGTDFATGADILIVSDVPEGKGVSSSAALEVATMMALTGAYDLSLEPRELALLCQVVENRVVGAPCGVMDQMTAACGRADHLLALLCQPAELLGHVAIPADLALWGVDSDIRHAVSGADYTSVRVGAFMGYRILAELAGLAVDTSVRPVRVDDPRWRGYLANVTPSEFEQYYAREIPQELAGAAFLDRYGDTTDPVTRVEPDRIYPVRTPTAHPIYEHFRVRTYRALLQGGQDEEILTLLGELMFQSHASYSACGLGSEGTDWLVDRVREQGRTSGLYGAKITGGGSGGTVAVLGRRSPQAEEGIERLAETYGEVTGRTPTVFRGSSPGAASVGVLSLA